MSRSALAFALPFVTAPVVDTPELAPWVGSPVAPGWQAWSERLDAVLDASCTELKRRGRRARRLTVTLRLADGRKRSRTLTIDRPSDQAADFRPAALGLLRLLVDSHPKAASRVSVALGQLVEGPNAPIQFERYLARRRSPWQRLKAWLFN